MTDSDHPVDLDDDLPPEEGVPAGEEDEDEEDDLLEGSLPPD